MSLAECWVGGSGLLPFALTLAIVVMDVEDGGDHDRTIRRLGHWGSDSWITFSTHDHGGRHRRAVFDPVSSTRTRRPGPSSLTPRRRRILLRIPRTHRRSYRRP